MRGLTSTPSPWGLNGFEGSLHSSQLDRFAANLPKHRYFCLRELALLLGFQLVLHLQFQWLQRPSVQHPHAWLELRRLLGCPDVGFGSFWTDLGCGCTGQAASQAGLMDLWPTFLYRLCVPHMCKHLWSKPCLKRLWMLQGMKETMLSRVCSLKLHFFLSDPKDNLPVL